MVSAWLYQPLEAAAAQFGEAQTTTVGKDLSLLWDTLTVVRADYVDNATERGHFDNGTNGNTISTTEDIGEMVIDTGGGAGGGAITFSNAQAHRGGLSAKIDMPTGGVDYIWRNINFASAQTATKLSVYVYVPDVTIATSVMPLVQVVTAANTPAAQLVINTTQNLVLRDQVTQASGSTPWDMTPYYDQWVRFDWEMDVTADTQTVWMFTGANLDSPDPAKATETTSGACASQASLDRIRIGAAATTGNPFTYYLDDLAYNHTTMPVPTPPNGRLGLHWKVLEPAPTPVGKDLVLLWDTLEFVVAGVHDEATETEHFESGNDADAISTSYGIFDGGADTGSPVVEVDTAEHLFGTRSMRIYTPAGSTTYRTITISGSNQPVAAIRAYMKITGMDLAGGSVIPITANNTGNSLEARIDLDVNDDIGIQNVTTPVGTEDDFTPYYDKWVRIEWVLDATNDTQYFRLWGNPHDIGPPDIDNSGAYTGGGVSQFRLGGALAGTTNNVTMWFDAVGWALTDEWIGPIGGLRASWNVAAPTAGTSVDAGVGAGTGTGNGSTTEIKVSAGVATGTGTGGQVTAGVKASASVAAATGTGQQPQAGVKAQAGVAAATAASNQPAVKVTPGQGRSFADNFNRPDGALGSNWLYDTSIAIGGEAFDSGTSSDRATYYATPTDTDDQWAEVTWKDNAYINAGLMLRGDGDPVYASTNGYRVLWTGSTQVDVRRIVDGVATFVNVVTVPALASGVVLRATVQGRSVRIYTDGTLRGTITDTIDFAPGKYVGIFTSESLSLLDNFLGGDLGGHAAAQASATAPTAKVDVAADVATATATGYNPTASTSAETLVYPGAASATAVADTTTSGVAVTSGATATGTAHPPTRTVTAPIGVATATGVGQQASGSVKAPAATATGTATGLGATGAVKVSAQVSTAAGAAQAVSAAHRASAGVAGGAGTGHTPTVSLRVPAGVAAATGAGQNPTPTRAGTPTPATATATGAGLGAVTSLQPTQTAASGAGAAYNPTVTVSDAITVTPATATGTGVAGQPSIQLSGATNATADPALASATSNSATGSVKVTAGAATGTGAAGQPTTLRTGRPTPATATATGTALNTTVTRTGAPTATPATATGVANTPTRLVSVPAGVAAGTGTANGASGSVNATAGATNAHGSVKQNLAPNFDEWQLIGSGVSVDAGVLTFTTPDNGAAARMKVYVGGASQVYFSVEVLNSDAASPDVPSWGAGQAGWISSQFYYGADGVTPALSSDGYTNNGQARVNTSGVDNWGTPPEMGYQNTGANVHWVEIWWWHTSAYSGTGTVQYRNPVISTTNLAPSGSGWPPVGVGDGKASVAVPAGAATATGTAPQPTATVSDAITVTPTAATATGTAHTPSITTEEVTNATADPALGSVVTSAAASVGGAPSAANGSVTKNLVTYNQATVEADFPGYEFSQRGAYTSIYRTTDQAAHGLSSLAITATQGGVGTGFNVGSPPGSLPACSPGKTYTGSIEVRAATVGRTMQVSLDFWTAAGAYIGGTVGGSVVTTTTGWQQITVTAVAPANAYKVHLNAVVLDDGAGEVQYADKMGIWEGSSTDWVLPGAPQPTDAVTVTPAAPSGVGAALQPTIQTTGTANAFPTTATAAAAAPNPSIAVTAPAGVAAGSGVASNPTALVARAAPAGVATAAGQGVQAAPAVKVTSGATATGTAPTPSVNTTGATNATADPALGTGTAYQPTVQTTGVTNAGAQAATATGTAYQPQAVTAGTTNVFPTAGTGSGTAPQPAGAVKAAGSVAQAAGASQPVTGAVRASAGVAQATGSVPTPSIQATGATNATADPATATAQALNPTVGVTETVTATPTTALAQGVAHNPTATQAGQTVAQAGVASASGATNPIAASLAPVTGVALAVLAEGQAAATLTSTIGAATGWGLGEHPTPGVGGNADSALAVGTPNDLLTALAATAQTAVATGVAHLPTIISTKVTLQVVVPRTAYRILVEELLPGPATGERVLIAATVVPTSLRRLVTTTGEAVSYETVELVEGDHLTLAFNLTYRDINGATQVFNLTGWTGLTLRVKQRYNQADGDAFFTAAGTAPIPANGICEVTVTATATPAGRYWYTLKGTNGSNTRTLAHGDWVIANV